MYIAVVSLIFGQGLIFGDFRILVYGLFVWAGSHVFVVMYEEPALRRSFPVEYAVYCEHVSRWIPRLKPWRERI
jgi:protein-S-isoprenylcysteine O-methyltransferase Ste14